MSDPSATDAQPPRPDRPRPQYGEYATPQEQAAIVARSLPPVSPALVPTPPAPSADATPAPSVAAPPVPTPPPARRRWDTILTVGLLAYGLISVLSSFSQYSDLASVIQTVYDIQGVGEFTPSGLATTMGPAIIITNVVLFALTAFLTVRRLRTPRLAFWIPVVGGVVAGLATLVMVVVVMVNDPAFVSFATSMN